eukprot:2184157-Amphidinium_carterae.1
MEELLRLIRQFGSQPNLWNVSLGCRVPKGNGKEKCAGERLIHLLDPVGKAHASVLWLDRQTEWQRLPQQSGFTAHRRREQTIVQLQATAWKLQQERQGWVGVFYDQSNAFPSVKYGALSSAATSAVACAFTPSATEIMNGRHERAMCFLQADSHAWTLFALGCGHLQGDRVAPEKFNMVFDPHVQAWAKANGKVGEWDISLEADVDFYKHVYPVPGETCLSVKHLGRVQHVDAWMHHELRNRRFAARKGWCAMGKFWTRVHFKRLVFLAMVQNTYLAGAETWLLTE